MYDRIIELMNELIEELLRYRLGEYKEVQQYSIKENDIATIVILNKYCENIGKISGNIDDLVHTLNAIHYYKKGYID